MQRKITIHSNIIGILSLPTQHAPKIPAVLLLHGFGSHKDEVNNTFLILAEKLAEQGIASLRIDFSGFGESEEDTAEATIDSMLDDAKHALAYLLEQEFTDLNHVGIVGFSLGAGISVLVTEQEGRNIKSMALLSPSGDFPADFREAFGFERYTQLEKSKEEMELDLGWRKIKLKDKFIQSLNQRYLKQSASHFHGALFAIAGEKDTRYCQHAKEYIESSQSQHKKLLVLEGKDHIFSDTQNKSSSVDQVGTEVASWLKITL